MYLELCGALSLRQAGQTNSHVLASDKGWSPSTVSLECRKSTGGNLPTDDAPAINPIGQMEECVSTNCGGVSHDPIADDDELEYMYQLAELQKPVPLVDPTKCTSTRVPESGRAPRSKERERSSRTKIRRGTVVAHH